MSDQLAVHALTNLLERNPALAREAAGWKVAMNFTAAQRKLGLTRALAAPLPRLQTYASDAHVPDASPLVHVEAELALRLGADVRSASDPLVIDSVAPCLELVDYAKPRDDLATMFAHSFFHAGIVLGEVRSLAQLALNAPYPRTSDRERLPGSVPDDVLDALAALRLRVLEAGGVLRKGQLVLCGSYIEPVPFTTRVEVDYGPQLGTLAIAR